MFTDWQSIVVALIIAAAAVYLARRVWRRLSARESASCATGCGKCGDETPAAKRVVMVELQGVKRR